MLLRKLNWFVCTGLLFFFTVIAPPARTQMLFTPMQEVAVAKQNDTLNNPWAGGMNAPQFSSMDLNDDGLQDLVTFERNFYGSVNTYLRTDKGFIHAPEYRHAFPKMRNWMLLRDYNCDGLKDIFTSVPGGIAVYKHLRDAQQNIKFELVETLLLAQTENLNTEPVYVAVTDIPAIVDVDGDLDLDILSFDIIGSRVVYYRNLSMENAGHCENLEYIVESSCWGYFSEDGNNNTVTLYDSCEQKKLISGEKHAGSSILAADLSGNGLIDLVIGDLTFRNMIKLSNEGTIASAVIGTQTINFPDEDVPVDITIFPAAYAIDVDNDGLDDMIVAPNNPNTSENHQQIWYYRKSVNQQKPTFSLQQKDFMINEMIDLGESSAPLFFDENADGYPDILAGSYGYFESSGTYSSQLMLLRHNGDTISPSFSMITNDYGNFSTFGFNGIYPTVGDIDADGDVDLIIGDEDGKLHLFTNQAGANNPASFVLTNPNLANIDVGQSAKPQIVDVNQDGLPDLLIGERSGKIRYHENTGTATQAQFGSQPTSAQFAGIDVQPDGFTGYSSPWLTQDSIGNFVLYSGSEQGYIFQYKSASNPALENFVKHDSLYMHAVKVTISEGDINKDGKPEWMMGAYTGGIMLYTTGAATYYGIPGFSGSSSPIKIVPNPVKEKLRIQINQSDVLVNAWSVYDLQGRMIMQKDNSHSADDVIDVTGLDEGLYVLKLRSEKGFIFTMKFIKN